MQIVGFGAEQLSATPQISQALSSGGSTPVPPALLFGTPNARVVPVEQTSNGRLPLNLTLQAFPTAEAIQQISRSAALAGLSSSAAPASSVPTVTNPPVPSAPPNSTAFVGATVPKDTQQSTPPAVAPVQTTSQPAAANGVQTAAPPANPTLVQQVVSTVQSLLIGKIYPAPVFSFLV